MLILLKYITVLTALVFAPLFLYSVFSMRNKIRNVKISWSKPEAIIMIVFALLVNLSLLILAMFFMAAYFDIFKGFSIIKAFGHPILKQLSLISFFLFIASAQIFVAIQQLFRFYVNDEGIFELSSIYFSRENVFYWERVVDYFLKEDFPLTVLNILYEANDGTILRKELAIPTPLLEKFKPFLEQMSNCENLDALDLPLDIRLLLDE